MNQIKLKIKKLTQPNTKSSYQTTITYLLNIVEALMVSTDQLPSMQSKRSLSEERSSRVQSRKVKHPKYDGYESSQYHQNQSFKGSQISLVEKFKKRAHWPEKQKVDKKQKKINLRQFQQSIEIYHQCLTKSIQLVEILQQKLCKMTNQSTSCLNKLKQFTQKYECQKQNCKDFNDLIRMCRQVLAQQYLSAIHHIRQPLAKRRYEQGQVRYLVVYE